jgi:hypothetical protein
MTTPVSASAPDPAGLVSSIEFRKKHNGFGPAPQGETSRVSLASPLPLADATLRCWRIFKRDHAPENQMAWEISEIFHVQ